MNAKALPHAASRNPGGMAGAQGTTALRMRFGAPAAPIQASIRPGGLRAGSSSPR